MESRKQRLEESSRHLKQALKLYHKAEPDSNRLQFLTVAKAFEICVEYAWKELKRRVEDEGLDAPSPKEAVRQAARLGFISDADMWINCINARNDSVHDYFNIPEKDYVKLAETFLTML